MKKKKIELKNDNNIEEVKFDYDDDIIVKEDIEEEVKFEYDDDIIVKDDEEEKFDYDDDIIVKDDEKLDYDDDVIVKDDEEVDYDDDVIVNDDDPVIINDEKNKNEEKKSTYLLSDVLKSFQAADIKHDTISPKSEGYDENDIERTAPKVIEKLLDFECPAINEETFNMLLNDECLEIFMNYIIRIPLSDNLESSDETNDEKNPNTKDVNRKSRKKSREKRKESLNMENVVLDKNNIDDYDIEIIDENELFLLSSYITIDDEVYRERDMTDTVAIKRSYNAMEILCSQSHYSERLLKEKCFEIANNLLNIFHPKSDGNINHFRKIWDYLIIVNRNDFADLLVSPDHLRHAFYDMLRYVHESAVMSTIVKTIFSVYYSTESKKKIFGHLEELDFIEAILSLLDIDKPLTISAASELFDNIIEESSKNENSNMLFVSVQLNPSCIINLIDNIAEKTNYGGEIQRNASIEVLYSIVTKSIYTPVPSIFDDKPPPPPIYPLQQFRFSVFRFLREFVWDLCLGMQYSLSNTKKIQINKNMSQINHLVLLVYNYLK